MSNFKSDNPTTIRRLELFRNLVKRNLPCLTNYVASATVTNMANKSSKLKHPPMRIYLRLYPEHDLSLMAYLREKMKKLDRSASWVIREDLRRLLEID